MEKLTKTSGENNSAMEYECEKYIAPEFFSGDIVACKKVTMDKLWFQWGKTYVISTTQGELIKVLKKGEDDSHITAVSLNKEKYEPFQLPTDEIHAGGIALVVGLIRIM